MEKAPPLAMLLEIKFSAQFVPNATLNVSPLHLISYEVGKFADLLF